MVEPIDPPDSDRAAWRLRQDALPTNWIPDSLEPHEVRFYERFNRELGQDILLIPKDTVSYLPTNDFIWVSKGQYVCELKGTSPFYRPIKRLLTRAVRRANRKGVNKQNFVVDLGREVVAPNRLRGQLADYNTNNPANQITRMWIVDANGISEVSIR